MYTRLEDGGRAKFIHSTHARSGALVFVVFCVCVYVCNVYVCSCLQYGTRCFLAVACWAWTVCLGIAFMVRWQFDPTVLGPILFNIDWLRFDILGQICDFGEIVRFVTPTPFKGSFLSDNLRFFKQ